MEDSKIKDLSEDLQKASRVIVNQLKEYIRQNEGCACSCHGASKELNDKEACLSTIESKMKESQDLIKRFMDRDRENKGKLTSLLEENDRLKASLDDLTKTFNETVVSIDTSDDQKTKTTTLPKHNRNQDRVSTNTTEEQRTKAVNLPEDNRSHGNAGKMLVLRNPNMEAQRIEQDTHQRQSDTLIHPNVSSHYERLRGREKLPVVKIWEWSMEGELEKAKVRANILEDGIQTVICLDTSSSMLENNAWEQACIFLNDYISGLETEAANRGTHKEYVGIVTFGFNTMVLHDLTNDYGKLREVLNSVEISGPSPLYQGINLTCVLWRGQGAFNTHYNLDGFIVHPKLILISDGQPTDTFLSQGPDRLFLDTEEETKSRVLDITEDLKNALVDVFCVPVGDGNTDFLDFVVGYSNGVKLTHKDGDTMARRTTLTIQVSKEVQENERNPFLIPILYQQHVSEDDKREKKEILERSDEKVEKRLEVLGQRIHSERKDTSLPAVGTRVRRGPDWPPADTDDGFGPGTIVGHNLKELKVWVNWDLKKLRQCRYGADGYYDLTPVDEYAELSIRYVMGVGCKVHPGRDWPSGETDRRLTGVSIQCAKTNRVKKTRIKWNNGTSGWYTAQNPEQVFVCGRRGRCSICDDPGSTVPPGAQGIIRPNKNINKNINKNMDKK